MLYTIVILALIALCIYIFFAFGLPKIVSLYASGKFQAEVSIGTIDLGMFQTWFPAFWSPNFLLDQEFGLDLVVGLKGFFIRDGRTDGPYFLMKVCTFAQFFKHQIFYIHNT